MDKNNNIALKLHLIEDAEHTGFGMGENWEGEYYADERDISGTELTMLLWNSVSGDALVYIILIPSPEAGYYDAWMRSIESDTMHRVLHCRAVDVYEAYHQLELHAAECLFGR